jgi:hypothetical protein
MLTAKTAEEGRIHGSNWAPTTTWRRVARRITRPVTRLIAVT